ncbi:MAG: hypothetical protein IT422_08895 [Pirellulaceae bacterium]|jgi:hypothetical protein|nr:hypothetical protein [Pirellulaceae bacterium]
MNLQWLTNAQLSVIHSAWCVAYYPNRVNSGSDEMRSAAAELDKLASEFKTTRDNFWEQLLTLACVADGPSDLAKRLSARLGVSSGTLPVRLVAALQQCRMQFERTFPKFATELPLRSGPMRQLWEAYGPGLLRLIGRQTGEDVAVEQASVVLVQPMLGGFGYAHLSGNRIHLEALLTHAAPELPESLRIAWLLSQLDLDRPEYSEQINAHRLRSVAGLAMLPAILCAGEELELSRFSPELLTRAIELWFCPTMGLTAAAASSVTSIWWETYQASRPKWRVALTGLDRLLPSP